MKIKEIIIITILSGFIGALAALPVILILKSNAAIYLPLSAGIGAFFGIVAQFSFKFFFYIFGRNSVPAFLAIAVVIAFGTTSGSLMLGMKQAGYIALMIAISEVLGIVVAVLTDQYYKRLNKKLQELKDKFK